MADDAKIRIPIDIPPGDLSGVDAAKREIAEVKQAADAAEDPALVKQRIEDVGEAKRRVHQRNLENITKETAAEKEAQLVAQDSARARVAAGAVLAASARQIAALTVDVIGQYKELGVEIGAFEDIGLEFANFLTSPFEYVTEAFTGYKEELKLLQEGQREVARAEAVYQETLAKRDAQLAAASERRINQYLAGEKAGIEEATAAYERQLRVVNAIAKAEEARAKVADAIALANGADPNQVAAGAAARAAAAGKVEQDQRVAAAEREVEVAIEKFRDLGSALAEANAAARPNEARIERLSQDQQAAQDAIRDAQLELDTVRTEAAVAKDEIASTATAEFQDLTGKVGAGITAEAESAIAAIEGKAKEQGGNISSLAQQSLDALYAAVSDNIPDAQQADRIEQAMRNFQQSYEGREAKTFAAIQALIDAVRKRDAEADSLQRQAEDLARRVTNLGG